MVAEPEEPRPRHDPDVRFSLANERTLLAYQRTAIGLIAAAVAVAHFLDDGTVAITMGGVLLATGAVAALGGYRRYQEADRAIREDRALPQTRTPLLVTAGILICLVVALGYVVSTVS